MQAKDEELIKLIVVGDCGVGKTNLLIRYCQDKFKNNYVSTIGVDFKIKSLDIDGTRIKLQIWDTAGQERFKNLTQTYYKNAAGIILVYSVIDPVSFDSLERWMQQINDHAPSSVVKMVVGNKADCEEERKVDRREGQSLGRRFDVPFMEVSAKEGTNVNQAFEKIARMLLEQGFPGKEQMNGRYSLGGQTALQPQSKKCQC